MKIWCEDIEGSPIMWMKGSAARLTGGCWNPARISGRISQKDMLNRIEGFVIYFFRNISCQLKKKPNFGFLILKQFLQKKKRNLLYQPEYGNNFFQLPESISTWKQQTYLKSKSFIQTQKLLQLLNIVRSWNEEPKILNILK